MRNKYTKELVEPIVARSSSWADVCREVGIKPYTGSQTHLTNKAKSWGIDYSHFTGKLWSKGKTIGYKQPVEHYLTKDSTISSDKLKKRLIKAGIKKHICENCGITDWQGEPTPLELDHINRNHYDNRIENLKILCPNCHSQKTNKDRRARLGKR